MNDQRKTKAQLLVELATLRQRVADLENHGLAPETELQPTREALLANQQNLAALIENTDGSIWSVDTHYRLIVGNELYHRNVSAALGRRLMPGESVLQPAFPPVALAEWQGYYDRALRGEHFSIVVRTRFAQHPSYIEYHFNPIITTGGTPSGVTVFGRDITLAQQAEEQLRERESRHRVIAELMSDYVYSGVVYQDGTAQTDWISGAFERITGYTPDEIQLLPGGFASLLVTEDLAGLLEQQPHLFDGEAISVEYRIRNRAGEIRWLRDAMRPDQPVFNPPGMKLLGAVQDITARKLAEAAVREGEAQLRSFFQHSPIGLAMLDRDFRFLVINDMLAQFNDLSVTAHLGQPLALVKPTVAQNLEPLLKQVLATNEPVLNVAVDKPTGDGRSLRHFVSSIFPILDSQGAISTLGIAVTDITEQHQVEDQLVQSEAKFRAFVEQSSEGVVITDEQGRIIEWNRAMEQLSGLPRTVAMGQMLWDVQTYVSSAGVAPVIPSDQLKVLMREALHTGQTAFLGRSYEADILTSLGEHKSILQLAFPIQTDAGYRIGAVIRDITERKQTEAALRRSEEKYRLLVDTASEGIWAMDREHRTTYVNQAMADLLGYLPSEMIGRPVEDFFFAEDMAFHDQRMQQRHAGQDEVYERRFRRRDGSSLWTLVSARATKDAAGEFSGSFAMFTDITARKQAEAALRENEARLKGFLDATPDAMVIANTDGRIILANTQTERLFGYTQTELLEMMVERLLPDRVRDIHRDNRAAFLVDPREVTTGNDRELHALRKDGSEFPVEISLSHHQLGDEVVVLSAIRDVTVRRQAEELVAAQRDLARLMTTAESDTAAWAQCLSIALRVSGLDSGGLYLFDDDQTTLSLVYQSGLSADFIAVSNRYSLQTVNVQGVLQGHPVYFTAADISRMPSAQAEGLRAVAAIPILHRGRVIGALNTASHTTPQISPAACRALETIAAEIGNIIVYRRTETALRESEARARAMLNAIPDLMFRLNRAGVFLDYKADIRELVAQTELTLIGLRNRDIAPAAFADLIDTQIAATLSTGTLHTFEYQLETPDQGVHDYEARMVPSGSDEVMAIVRDITERKQVELALQDSREKYRSLLESLDSIVAVIDAAGRFLYMNEVAARQLGGMPDQFIGRTMTELFPEPYASQQFADIQDVIRTGRPVVNQTESYVHGQSLWYRNSLQPIHDEAGRPVQVLLNTTDITPIIQAQHQLEEINRMLEERVAQRTQELATANASLAAANDRLLDLDRLKSKFVSDVSHELRTPVTSLSLYIDLLEHGKLEKRDLYVGKLKEQMARLHTLINDILDLSRLERDWDAGGRSPVDINSIVEHVSAMERGAAETAGLTLTCEVADNLPLVVARPDQLTRAVTNLVSNAIKYTPQGAIRVQTSAQDQRVCIEVTDTGLGIPPDELSHVFERFYRGRDVAQSAVPGSGLGLSIVKEIVESHGGTVEVQSALGQGSTFFIWLPIA